MVLSLQEEARIKNSQELIQLLQELQRSTSQVSREIGTAAHQEKEHEIGRRFFLGHAANLLIYICMFLRLVS